MKIRDLMIRDVVTCAPEDTLAAAARKMWDHDCGILPVVEPGGRKLLGVITDRDACMGAYTQGVAAAQIPVSRVMSRQAYTCSPDAELSVAHAVMRQNQVRRVPVVDSAREIVGLISLNDLALHAAAGTGPQARSDKLEVADTLAACCRHHVAAGV